MNLNLDTTSVKSDVSNIYTVGNKIVFIADITHSTAGTLIKMLYELEQLSLDDKSKLVVSDASKSSKYNDIVVQAKPIVLELTTPGGTVVAAYAIINCMNNLKVDVHTIINGQTSSAGTLISLAGKKRYMYKHSYVLIHEIRSGMWGKLTFLEDQYNNTQKMMNDIVNYYKKY